MNIDLSMEYLELTLRSPIVASALRFTGQSGVLRRLDASGVRAAALPTLFEEQPVSDS